MVLKVISSKFAYYCRNLQYLETPQLVYEKLREGDYTVLLESSKDYIPKTSEFSIIPVNPEMLITLKDSELTLQNLTSKLDLGRTVKIKDFNHLKSILAELIASVGVDSKLEELSHLPF